MRIQNRTYWISENYCVVIIRIFHVPRNFGTGFRSVLFPFFCIILDGNNALCYNYINKNTSEESGLCFSPLELRLETKMYIIRKKYQLFSPIAQLLVKELS